jgi:23S rRNA pseudouridine1911/1915/1917 synthase
MDQATYHIKAHDSGKRLDAFLSAQEAPKNAGLARSGVIRAIESREALVNGKGEKPSYRLKTGDVVVFAIPELTQETPVPNPDLPLQVVFEDESILVVDKPAGTQVHPARNATHSVAGGPSAVEKTGTVANWLVARYPAIAQIGEDPMRPGIVHRLDKNTSGLLVVAKTQEAFEALKRLFAHRKVTKTYLALVHGHIDPKEGVIDTPIARAATLRKQSVATENTRTRGTVRQALTEYSVLERYPDFDFVEARPKTGRMHQIRVHLASIGHPVVGDFLYGTKITRAQDKALSRHFLHAHKLSFTLFDRDYSFESPLPPDLQALLRTLLPADSADSRPASA